MLSQTVMLSEFLALIRISVDPPKLDRLLHRCFVCRELELYGFCPQKARILINRQFHAGGFTFSP